MMTWEEATPFDDQEKLTEEEVYFIKLQIKKGFYIRFTDTHVYSKHGKDGLVISVMRKNLRTRREDRYRDPSES